MSVQPVARKGLEATLHSDFLFIVAEIAAAFAGFASLVAVISRRDARAPEQEQLDFYTLQNVLLLSLLTIAFALLPNLLERQVQVPTTAWRLSATVFLVVVGSYVGYTLRALPRAYRGVGRALPTSFRANAGILIVGLVAQILLAVGSSPPSTYLMSLAALLYCAGFGFVRLFVSLRPHTS